MFQTFRGGQFFLRNRLGNMYKTTGDFYDKKNIIVICCVTPNFSENMIFDFRHILSFVLLRVIFLKKGAKCSDPNCCFFKTRTVRKNIQVILNNLIGM